MLIALYQETSSQRIERASAAIARACEAILHETTELPASAAAGDITAKVSGALAGFAGVEGGVWRSGVGSIAYAFPSYEGTGTKSDLPQAEEPTIREVAEGAAAVNHPLALRRDAPSQVLLLQGCPFPDNSSRAAWSMTRVITIGGRPFLLATTGLALLLIVLLGSAALLARLLWRWSERLRSIETALAGGAEDLPTLKLTGQRDLDRIVGAINGAGAKAADARRRSDELRRRVAQSERLATLGRLAAGVAHEIRNPIAAMRLKAENALVENAEPGRARDALRVVVDQVGRMEHLLQNLLRSVQRSEIRRQAVPDIERLMTERASLFAEQAGRRPISVDAPRQIEPAPYLDATQIGRALDNLILNAIQNSPDGAAIELKAVSEGSHLSMSVTDYGHGVPAHIREHLFEPFATGRADGTGLGLAIVREVVEAHGGRTMVKHRCDGTTFVIELPLGAPS